jgi:hypothetical protein
VFVFGTVALRAWIENNVFVCYLLLITQVFSANIDVISGLTTAAKSYSYDLHSCYYYPLHYCSSVFILLQSNTMPVKRTYFFISLAM